MIGGSPIFVAPSNQPRPPARTPPPTPPPRPGNNANTRTPAPPPGRPTVRAQAPDETSSGKVAIPSPGQLGIVAARPGKPSLDWQATRRQLQDLRAESFQLEQLAQGGFRFTCLLSGGVGGPAQRIEGQGVTEAEAVRVALDQAERWRSVPR